MKKLSLLPDDAHATAQIVADYYEVDLEAVRRLVSRHREELADNGLRLHTASELRELLKGQAVPFKIPNRGMHLFTRRAVLRSNSKTDARVP